MYELRWSARNDVEARDRTSSMTRGGESHGAKGAQRLLVRGSRWKLIVITLQVCATFNWTFTSAFAQQDAGTPSIDDLEKQLAQKKAESGHSSSGASSSQNASTSTDHSSSPNSLTILRSGVSVMRLTKGAGANPQFFDEVQVRYELRLANGNGAIIDSSKQHGGPTTVSVSGVIPCWTEALRNMKVGDKSRVTCPPQTAYGDVAVSDYRNGPVKIPAGSTLIYEIELLGIVK